MRSFEPRLCSFTSNVGSAVSSGLGGGASAAGLAGSAATMGLSMLPAVASFIAGKVGQGRKAANGLTQGLQQDFTDQVLVPLAELRKTNPQAAAAQMEPAWAAFQQQANQYGAKDANTAKVVQQMLSTPAFMNTVGSILGRDPKAAPPAQQQQVAQTQQQGARFPTTQQQNYAGGNTQGGGGGLLAGLGQAGAGVLGALTNRGNPYQSSYTGPQGNALAGGSALGGVLGKIGGGILGGLGGGRTGGGTATGGTATGGQGGTGGTNTNTVNVNDSTPWDKILPLLAGIGTKAAGDVLDANAMNKRNDLLRAQAAAMTNKANTQQQQRNYYASSLMPSILQGLGNRNPNQIQQATQQMNTAKFPTS